MEEKKELKKKRNSGVKKTITGLLALVLIVGATIALTLAFLKTTSDTVTNTFTASEDIKLGLDEPNYNEKVWTDSDGDGVQDEREVELKYPTKPDPSNYVPEQEYLKDPTLYNLTGSSEGTSEWVAMRVDYTMGDATTGTDVTYTQLTHSCDENSIDEYNGNDTTKCFRYSTEDEDATTHICSYASDKTNGTGVIDTITFDADEYDTNDGWETSHNWIRLTSNQIRALLLTEEENNLTSEFLAGTTNTKKYDIFVYKYKLTEKNGTKTLQQAQAETTTTGLEVAKFVDGSYNNGGKTTSLFNSITTKTKTQLGINGYVDTTDTLHAPKFEIKLKGAAAKNDDTVTSTSISASDIDTTISKYVTNNGKDEAQRDTVSETDSYRIVKELVQLLDSAS